MLLAIGTLNMAYGVKPPYPRARFGRAVKRSLEVLGDRVNRFFLQLQVRNP